MSKRSKKKLTKESPEPDHVHTSKSGRKYIIADEVIHLPVFKDRLERLRKLIREPSRLVSG